SARHSLSILFLHVRADHQLCTLPLHDALPISIEENMALASCRGIPRRLSGAVKASMRDEFRGRLETLGLGLENRLTDRIGLLSRSEEHTSELQSRENLVCRLLLEKK